MKHTLKRLLREAWSRLLYYTGLWRLVDSLTPRRMLILAGHCVDDPATNAGLPADMKIEPARLERILGVLGRRFRLETVTGGLEALRDGSSGPSLVALTMDDGYADNERVLLPLLERAEGKATVYLEARVLTEGRVNWAHKWFWLLDRIGVAPAGRELAAELPAGELRTRFEAELARGGRDLAYRLKRVLKYEGGHEVRDGALDALFLRHGGDEAELAGRIHLNPEAARALAASGRVELGGHTRRHEVLATLDAEQQREEIAGARSDLEELFGPGSGRSFAYPYGRRWDFNGDSVAAVQAAGYGSAVTTHAGVVTAGSDPLRLPRWMIADETPLHLLVCEACGGFELLRRLGLDLAE